MDEKDKALLEQLDHNARVRLSSLAKTLRASKSAVARRIHALENEGIIQGYYAVIDASRLGHTSVRVYIKFNHASPKMERRFIQELLDDDRVWWVGTVHGNWDLGFVIWVNNLHEFRNSWLKLALRYRRYIGEHRITPYTKMRYYGLRFDRKNQEEKTAGIVGEGAPVDIDATDAKILKSLAADARQPVLRLAQKTGLTPAIVKYRLRQLQKSGVLLGTRSAVNMARLGYSLYKLDLYLDDVSRLPDVQAFLESQSSLAYIDETIGGADLEADVYLKSPQELEELLTKLKQKFGSALRKYDYLTYSRVLKYAHFPG